MGVPVPTALAAIWGNQGEINLEPLQAGEEDPTPDTNLKYPSIRLDPTTITTASPNNPEPTRKDQLSQAQQLQSPDSSFTATLNEDVKHPDFHQSMTCLRTESESGAIDAQNTPEVGKAHLPQPGQIQSRSPQALSFTPALDGTVDIPNFHSSSTATIQIDHNPQVQQQNSVATNESTPAAHTEQWTDLSVWEYDLDTPSAQEADGVCSSDGFVPRHPGHLMDAVRAAAVGMPTHPHSLLTPCTEYLPEIADNSDFRSITCLCTPTNLRVVEQLHEHILAPLSKPLDQVLALACNGVTVCEGYLLCPICQCNTSSMLSCVLIMQLVFRCYASSLQPPSHGRSRGLSESSIDGADSNSVKIGSFEVDERHRVRVVEAIVRAEMERGRGVLERLERALESVASSGMTEAIGGVVRAIWEEAGPTDKG
ncbi:hypothetical protein GP486_006310 [Trichoglossum hirsutum]|uniref:Uncharacterized protein n=1 Tax=Trichoglossum hirsutum TaxID=265104 RepID=A0A9P8IK72_9PEZI|nr:hypothetical protein GP486_006310 [Trichoglossum hirsutum]